MDVVGQIMAIWPQKHSWDTVFGVKYPFFHELHLFFFLQVDSILNFDYFHTPWATLDLLGTRVGHNLPPLWTICSGFESSHNKLGTNLDCFLTFWDGMTAHHPLFNPNFTIFGVKCPFFHGWHPLFFLLLASLLDFSHPLKKKKWTL